MKIRLRPSVPSDFEKLNNGKLPPYRVKAWTGVLGDEVLGVGGIAYLADGSHGVFLLSKEEDNKRFPVFVHKAGLMVLQEAKRLGVKKLCTFADPRVDASERWLVRLGFEQTQIGNEKVWIRCLH